MQHEELQQLVKKFLNNTATAEEQERLADWYKKQDTDETEWVADVTDEEQLLKNEMLAYIQQQINGNQTAPVRKLWPYIAAAASILVFLSVGGYFLLNKQQQQVALVQKQDILPGGNKAILTLSNGRQIILSNVKNGRLSVQGSAAINKTANGQIVYTSSNLQTGNQRSEIQYNTMTTPRGGQYHLTLQDGTNVWLNAASSIKFPVAFVGAERRVEITGEVYFEVVHNAEKPFRVVARGQTIEDLGTHFDVNAYTDEPVIKTTLIEGKVRVAQNNASAILMPGQQALIFNNSSKISVVKADTTLALAWKNGLFKFHEADLSEVMRQLARWYNVKVVLHGDVSDRQFSGEITRDVNMSEVFEILSYLKVNFHIGHEGNQVVITVNPQ